MSWGTKDVTQRRIEFVIRAASGREQIRALCREFEISPQTGYKWLERFRQAGTLAGVQEQSRRPLRSPTRTSAEREALLREYESCLRVAENRTIVILSGSLPKGLAPDDYATLIRLGHRHGARVFLDTSGEPLRLGLQQRPDFAKPNQEEAEWLIHGTIDGATAASTALQTLLREGPRSAAISLGAKGLVWRGPDGWDALVAIPPKLEAASAVGSGDATIAGFAFAASRNFEPPDMLRLAVACGAANCLADLPGRVRLHDVERLRKLVQIQSLPQQ